MRPRTKKWIGLGVCMAIILGALGVLLFGKLEKNIVYFVTPSELLDKGEAAYDQPVRLGGAVKKGSILWDTNAIRLQFLLSDGTRDVPVLSQTTPPQMFQEGMGVVVEGKLRQSGAFETERLMVRHSNEYHPPKEGEKPEILYKGLVQ